MNCISYRFYITQKSHRIISGWWYYDRHWRTPPAADGRARLEHVFPSKAIRFVMEYNQEFLLPPVKADCNHDIYALWWHWLNPFSVFWRGQRQRPSDGWTATSHQSLESVDGQRKADDQRHDRSHTWATQIERCQFVLNRYLSILLYTHEGGSWQNSLCHQLKLSCRCWTKH